MKNISVLGSGLVGSVIAKDLARDSDFAVTVYDASERSLSRLAGVANVRTQTADLASKEGVARSVADADVVVGAVPGFLGRQMLETVINAGKPIADISFSPEDPLDLDGAAKSRGVTAVIDCGVSPGLSNLAVGLAAATLSPVDSVTICVGGLPKTRRWPYEYGIVFSATDVIEEYTRPARIRRGGQITVVPALSEVELIDFPEVGTLEAFLTDGLRTLLATVPARNMEEKTLRYPGHADKMRLLRESGFFRDEPIEIDGARVAPRSVAEALLFERWRMAPGEEEFTVLRVTVEGMRGGKRTRLEYELFDRTDAETKTTSMARTTGFPCAMAARLIARGEYSRAGVAGLEELARNEKAARKMIDDLRARGVVWRERESNP